MYNVQLIHSFHCFEFIELTLIIKSFAYVTDFEICFDEGILVKGKGLEGITFILNYVDNVYFGQRQFPEPVLIYRGVTGYYPKKENGTIVQVSQSQGMGLLNEGNALRWRMQSFA